MAIATEPYVPSAAQMKQQFLEDLQLQAMDAGVAEPPIQPGSEWDLLATGLANIGSIAMANQQLYDIDSDSSRAEGAALDEYRVRLQLPFVGASLSTGPVTITTVGTATISAGQRFQAPNGFVAEVLAEHADVSGNITVDAQMTMTGEAGNLLAGTRVRLTGGPPNLLVEATIPEDWIGGKENEDDARKRVRIQNRIKNAGSNWGDIRDKALEASNAVGNAYVYRALGGPGAVKVALTSNTSTATREVGTGTVSDVQDYLDAAFPDGTWLIEVQSASDLGCDTAIGLRLPTIGRHRWLAGGPTNVAYVSAMTSETDFTIDFVLIYGAGTIGTLSAGETLAYWDPVGRTAATATVASVSGLTIKTGTWSGGAGPAVGSGWIFPACDDLAGIVEAWETILLSLGPGENVATTDARYPFASRMPPISGTDPANLTNLQLTQLLQAVPEATDISYRALTSLSIPALASDPPNILRINRFAIYPI